MIYTNTVQEIFPLALNFIMNVSYLFSDQNPTEVTDRRNQRIHSMKTYQMWNPLPVSWADESGFWVWSAVWAEQALGITVGWVQARSSPCSDLRSWSVHIPCLGVWASWGAPSRSWVRSRLLLSVPVVLRLSSIQVSVQRTVVCFHSTLIFKRFFLLITQYHVTIFKGFKKIFVTFEILDSMFYGSRLCHKSTSQLPQKIKCLNMNGRILENDHLN